MPDLTETLGHAGVNLDEALAGEDDLARVQRALVRERAIRDVMAKTSESREIVAEAMDAMASMDQEAVLDLADGRPTTLADALTRYVRIMADWDEVIPRDQVAGDLSAILEYPWRDEEALVQLHEPNGSLRLEIREDDSEHWTMLVGGHEVAAANHDEHGWSGMTAMRDTAEAVHQAVLARVIPDRPHHVQLSSSDRRSLMEWLERPSGSWISDDGSRVTVDAVEGGGILVRTRPYSFVPAPHKRG